MTNLAFLNMHGMSQEKNVKKHGYCLLALLDQLLEVGHFITALEKIDMNNRPLLSATCLEQDVIKRY